MTKPLLALQVEHFAEVAKNENFWALFLMPKNVIFKLGTFFQTSSHFLGAQRLALTCAKVFFCNAGLLKNGTDANYSSPSWFLNKIPTLFWNSFFRIRAKWRFVSQMQVYVQSCNDRPNLAKQKENRAKVESVSRMLVWQWSVNVEHQNRYSNTEILLIWLGR